MDRRGFFGLVFRGLPEQSLIEIATGDPPNRRQYLALEDLLAYEPPLDQDAYYGPAPRKSRGGEKADVAGSRVVWADVDDVDNVMATLLPSLVVRSGRGLHLYWLIDRWITDVEELEAANKAVQVDTGADHCWNANRLLRIPDTRNLRHGEALTCSIRRAFPDRVYRLEDFGPLAKLDKAARHKIRTGDQRGHRSRSERDWSVVCALVDAGADDELIRKIFDTQPVGDKYREEESGRTYLDRTTAKARERKTGSSKREIEEHEDGYYIGGKRGARRVSTFTLVPRLLLADVDKRSTSEDAILCDVVAGGYRWNDVAFTRSAFTSVAKLDRETRLMAWQWLGSDSDVRLLLPYLLAQLQEQGLPKVAATRVLGLHHIGDRHLYVGDVGACSAEESFHGVSGPLVYVEPGREHPHLVLGTGSEGLQGSTRDRIRDLLPRLNTPEAIWPMVGWYAAAPLKPVFEERGYRFPILNVHGTRGSGKTTLIQRVMMPLFGQKDPKSYDANTTRFVILSVLGSSNAVPVAFSEFRFGSAGEFLRYILLAYDTGHDPRGRADQTTVDYPLSAPFSVDGEDLVADPAAKERIVAVTLHPSTIAEGSEPYKAYAEIRKVPLERFGEYYLQRALTSLVDGVFDQVLAESRRELFDAFPGQLPDRVRANFIVVRCGIHLVCRALDTRVPDCGALARSVHASYDIERGRAPVLADEMVEDVVNAVANAGRRAYFAWHYDSATSTLWFQLAPAHSWWVYQRRRQNRVALERDAIRNQLGELEYILEPRTVEGKWMYGVNLKQATTLGLDVPEALDVVSIQF